MQSKRLIIGAWLLMLLPVSLLSQTEKTDLSMIYKIKQEGARNSAIEDLAYGLTDLTGPRLTGSSGYAEKYLADMQTRVHKPDYDKFAAYFNMDNGSGKYRGIYLQGNDMARPIFEEWLRPFEDMGAATVTIRNTGGTDHQTFDGLGLPAFQFIQDEIEYGRGYHTVMDTWERLSLDDLRHNAIITASFAYNAAMRDARLPLKPAVEIRAAPANRMIPAPAMN